MIKKICLVFMCLCTFLPKVYSQEFFDTSDAPQFFTFGGRVGFNTSNRTFPNGNFNQWNYNGWGTGFNVGVVANLNFKEYLSIQPGIFFDSRSGGYSYLSNYINVMGQQDTHYQMGHLRGYNLIIPVMGIVKFNVTENVKWLVEFGPYLQFSLKQTGQNGTIVLYRTPSQTSYEPYAVNPNKFDFGFKMGSGLKLFEHYYIGFHYLAGVCHAWSLPSSLGLFSGGHNKEWTFTIGYDF